MIRNERERVDREKVIEKYRATEKETDRDREGERQRDSQAERAERGRNKGKRQRAKRKERECVRDKVRRGREIQRGKKERER